MIILDGYWILIIECWVLKKGPSFQRKTAPFIERVLYFCLSNLIKAILVPKLTILIKAIKSTR